MQAEPNGNIVRRDIPGETQPTTFRYDCRGNIVEAENSEGSIMLEYTDAGLPSMVTYSSGRQLEYTYDDNNRRTSKELFSLELLLSSFYTVNTAFWQIVSCQICGVLLS